MLQLGLKRFFADVVHHRERFRQFIGVMYIVLLAVAGAPLGAMTYYFGALIAVAGVAVRLWASGHIKKNKELATDGPYYFVRHPLYVGNILILTGFCLASGLWWSFPVFIALWICFYAPAIRHEDEKLHRLFGTQWEAWSRDTRALWPRFALPRVIPGSWSFKQSLMRNGEPIIALFLLANLYLLYTWLK